MIFKKNMKSKNQCSHNLKINDLVSIPRSINRKKLGIDTKRKSLPFYGVDIWNAYEISWLNLSGKPEIALASFYVDADTPSFVESKSMKFYLNSFNQKKIKSIDNLKKILQNDLSNAFGANVYVNFIVVDDFKHLKFTELKGISIDRLKIEITDYYPNIELLKTKKNDTKIEETLFSNLFKTNCPNTSQPDWASIQIKYFGNPIEQDALLKYLISYRNYEGFHEQCIEKIFIDILDKCKPDKLMVLARYTRRGGIDINPWRSNFTIVDGLSNFRNARQ